MSGTIALTHDARWSAAGWLFDWTVSFAAEAVTDPAVAAGLHEIVRENLGWVDVAGLPAASRTQLLQRLAGELVTGADAQLPPTLPERAKVLALLGDLAGLARQQIGSSA